MAPIRRVIHLAAALLLILPLGAAGQAFRVVGEQEVFHQTADGRRLATLMRDAPVTAVGREGAWMEVTLEGWIWSGSVAPTQRGGFDLVVSAAGGENLRLEPGGEIVARLLRGFLLESVETRGQWTRVRRTGWVRAEALAALGGEGAEPGGAPGASGSPANVAGAPSPPGAGERFAVEGPALGLRREPEGDTVAVVSSGAEVTVLERRDRWVRVRLEGWAPGSDLVPVAPEDALMDVSAGALRANPEQFEGRRVRWTVQFIALERAEAERTDFYEGEPFILARAPQRSDGFVYLAVPPELLEEVEGLRSLQSVDVLASVRTGRSALMGVPVLDLLALY